MPELPDITIYLEALAQRVLHQPLQNVRIASPFLLRTAVPPIDSVRGKRVVALRRIGKRIAIGRPITVPVVRPAANSWRTARFRCS
jgi:formamidopyrimidine-DNA glycosylase